MKDTFESVFEDTLKEEFDKLEKDYDGLQIVMDRVSANADALIAIGKEEWIRTRRKKKKPRKKSQQDQLREIEDGLVEDGK